MQTMGRSEEHTSELQSLRHLVCRLLLEKKKKLKNGKNSSFLCPRSPLGNPLVDGECRKMGAARTFRRWPVPVMSRRRSFFFFLMNRPPPKFPLFPQHAPFRI